MATGAQLARRTDSLALNSKRWLVWGVCTTGFMFDFFYLQIMAFVALQILKEWRGHKVDSDQALTQRAILVLAPDNSTPV